MSNYQLRNNPFALSFDGVDDYVELGDIHDFAGTAPFTIEFWAKLGGVAPDYSRVISKEVDGTRGWAIYQSQSSTTLVCFRQEGTIASLSTSLSIGIWTHIAFTYDGTNIRLYKDGLLVDGPTASAQSILDHANTLRFARESGGTRYWNGLMDEVRIWNVARTQPQIEGNMRRRLNGNESGLVGYWRMDEGTGLQTNDATANANHGTISGAAWVSDTTSLIIVDVPSSSSLDNPHTTIRRGTTRKVIGGRNIVQYANLSISDIPIVWTIPLADGNEYGRLYSAATGGYGDTFFLTSPIRGDIRVAFAPGENGFKIQKHQPQSFGYQIETQFVRLA